MEPSIHVSSVNRWFWMDGWVVLVVWGGWVDEWIDGWMDEQFGVDGQLGR